MVTARKRYQGLADRSCWAMAFRSMSSREARKYRKAAARAREIMSAGRRRGGRWKRAHAHPRQAAICPRGIGSRFMALRARQTQPYRNSRGIMKLISSSTTSRGVTFSGFSAAITASTSTSGWTRRKPRLPVPHPPATRAAVRPVRLSGGREFPGIGPVPAGGCSWNCFARQLPGPVPPVPPSY